MQFEIPLPGRHGVMNALAAIAVAGVFGIPPQRLTEAARSLRTGKMRGERIESGGITILNDCYNANPEAVRAMLDVLGATPARRRLAVLGEMLELGRSAEPLHREIGNYVAGRGIDVLIGIRGASRHMVDEAVRAGMSGAAYFFEDPQAAGDFLRGLARRGRRRFIQGIAGCRGGKGDGKAAGGPRGVAKIQMLYYLLYQRLFPAVRPFRVFGFVTFRTAFASLTALFLCIALGPWLIGKLREFQIGQHIREDGPQSHQKKPALRRWEES